ncbi:tRNA pseudouridine(55) synthase TruB [Kamptonema sp. UHCC 0994]|uniref:tRNA pseudouridine(55) synthase TruB n=1 Tax=Kamptonema sp. UHCC 0994 TaxID=3031329 RepID=UPI0023B9BDC7|nr:tRNA pseudouridine(55) synthase TruB [Kamptonema sp. UHCC 0994]MDF0555486.1 tRNA pseudouridine(55) synthase TruB [Kamptonema sp. UHCC 0994]
MTFEGFLNLNKPIGPTSHDCVARVRRVLKLKRVGHGGTLDPAVGGVLPIALGKATRLLQFLRHDKAYQGTIRFGLTTATDDLEGEILSSRPVPDLTLEQVKAALPSFQGKIQQIPPNYSAIHVDGKRLYDLARKGETVVVPSRAVEVFRLEILDWRPGDFPELDVAIACGAGTYIRAIARDLGAVLNVGGTLAALTRTESSGFHLASSLTFEELEIQLQQGTFRPITPSAALAHLDAIALDAKDATRWCQGQRLAFPQEGEQGSGGAGELLSEGALERGSGGAGELLSEGAEKMEDGNLSSAPLPLSSPSSHPVLVYDRGGQFLGIGQRVYSETGSILAPQIVF